MHMSLNMCMCIYIYLFTCGDDGSNDIRSRLLTNLIVMMMLLVLVTVAVETTVVNVITTNIITMVQDFLSNLCLLELINVRFYIRDWTNWKST